MAGTVDSKENWETEDSQETRVNKEGKPFKLLIYTNISLFHLLEPVSSYSCLW